MYLLGGNFIGTKLSLCQVYTFYDYKVIMRGGLVYILNATAYAILKERGTTTGITRLSDNILPLKTSSKYTRGTWHKMRYEGIVNVTTQRLAEIRRIYLKRFT